MLVNMIEITDEKCCNNTNERRRRDLVINQAIVDELNEHDEDGNTAAEEVNKLKTNIATSKYVIC